MKLLERLMTFDEAKGLCDRKKWSMLLYEDIGTKDLEELLLKVLTNNDKIYIWLGEEKYEIEKGIYVATVVVYERKGTELNYEVVPNINCLFKQRIIVK